MTTAEMESMKLLKMVFVSSVAREFAKLIDEQKSATHEHHLTFNMSPHIEKTIDNTFM